MLVGHEPDGLTAGELARKLAIPHNTLSTISPSYRDSAHRLPTDSYRSKSWGEFAKPGAPVMDFVFTVCDQRRAKPAPVWPGQPARR